MLNFISTPNGGSYPLSHINVLTLLLLASLCWSCSDNQPLQLSAVKELPVTTVSADTVTTFKEYPAAIEGLINVEVRPQVDGKIQQVFVDEGTYVQKGQLLFQLDDRPFRERLNNAKASLHASEGALANAKLEIDKLTPLVQNKVISSYQLKTAFSARETAEGNIEQARANVRTAQIDLEYTKLKAPVSGYIGRLNKRMGSLVTSNDLAPLTLLSDIHEVRVYFSLSESDFISFKKLYKGATLDEKLKNLPAARLVLADNSVYNLPGRIDMVDGQFDKNTGSVTLRATFGNPDRMLRSGNTGKVRLSLVHENTTLIPQESTIELQDKTFVFAVGDSNKVSRQPIIITGKSGDKYLVSSGIKAGTKIVASGIEHLKEGDQIKPQSITDIPLAANTNNK
jgi:membrane fusion protein (multidrug efflux system)